MSTSTPKPPNSWIDDILSRHSDAYGDECAVVYARSELAALRAENERLRRAADPLTMSALVAGAELERQRDSLRAQLAKCQDILRRCFAVEDVEGEGESVMSLDCPAIEDYRAALETKP